MKAAKPEFNITGEKKQAVEYWAWESAVSIYLKNIMDFTQ